MSDRFKPVPWDSFIEIMYGEGWKDTHNMDYTRYQKWLEERYSEMFDALMDCRYYGSRDMIKNMDRSILNAVGARKKGDFDVWKEQ